MILIEPKVIFFGSPVSTLSTTMIGLLSLFPGLLTNISDSVLSEFGNEKDILEGYSVVSDSLESSAETVTLKPKEHSFEQLVLTYKDPLEQQKVQYWSNLGLPLQFFQKGSLFQPSFSLLQIDQLLVPNLDSFVIGSSNRVLLQQKKLGTQIIVKIESGSVEIYDQQAVSNDAEQNFHDIENKGLFFGFDSTDRLQKILELTNADREFIGKIIETVKQTEPGQDEEMSVTHWDWEGSNAWIRQQFEQYLISFLMTVLAEERNQLEIQELVSQESGSEGVSPDEETVIFQKNQGKILRENLADFNISWVNRWRESQNYSLWHQKSKNIVIPSDLIIGHPCHTENGFNELRGLITKQVGDLGQMAQPLQIELGKVVNQSGKYIGEAFDSFLTNTQRTAESVRTNPTVNSTVKSIWDFGSKYISATMDSFKAAQNPNQTSTTSNNNLSTTISATSNSNGSNPLPPDSNHNNSSSGNSSHHPSSNPSDNSSSQNLQNNLPDPFNL